MKRKKYDPIIRIINNFKIETIGGFITVKYWIVYDENDEYKGTFFKFKNAKDACLKNDFSKAFKGGKLY